MKSSQKVVVVFRWDQNAAGNHVAVVPILGLILVYIFIKGLDDGI